MKYKILHDGEFYWAQEQVNERWAHVNSSTHRDLQSVQHFLDNRRVVAVTEIDYETGDKNETR